MTELETMERIRRRIPMARQAGVVAGIGDDCAIIRPRGASEDLLISTDLIVEDIHFRQETHSAAAIGHQTLARGLSDIAAMGGRPRYCFLSLALPGWARQRWIDSFYEGLIRLAEESGTVLLGGDLARAEKLTCDVVVCGTVPRGEALRRGAARPGDAVYISGRLGGSALGLSTGRGAGWRRHLRPRPRLELGQYLRRKPGVHAAMDVSDGLSIDLHRLAKESGLAARLDGALPVFPGASDEQALHGGEDYELLFTASQTTRLPARYRGLPITRIGIVEEGEPGQVVCHGQRVEPLGWDHFR